jgi:hypothetical protein
MKKEDHQIAVKFPALAGSANTRVRFQNQKVGLALTKTKLMADGRKLTAVQEEKQNV